MTITIDCRTCVLIDSSHCSDCGVTYISGREPGEAVIVDVAEFAALRRLAAAGLVPDVSHRPAATG